jgi:murein DD-endopeptidase MepM/ murein hydrolase activator NlpD
LAEPTAAVDLIAYQVNLGDTVAEIARAHSIPQSALIAANHLSDPNVIFVGQVLKLPEGQSAPQAKESINPSASAPMPSVLPISTAAQSDASAASLPTVPQQNLPTVAVVPSSILPAPSAAPDSSRLDVGTETAGRNPYVQNLLSEIKALQQQRSAPQPVAAVSLTSATNTSAAVNPSSDQSMQPAAPQALRSRLGVTRPAVVATAPLGSENYEPLMKPLTGRMVSPELPSLPNADHFLPEGMTTGYIWPAKGVLTSGYGWRWGRMHQGIDIASDIGTPVHAAANGVIQYAGWNSGGYGNMIEIRHADGSMTRYAHLNAIFVRQGQEVNQGEQIAEMGSTGYSTGPHLHFEVHPNGGSAVNPMAYLPNK